MTRKPIALSMAVLQISGSSSIMDILNGFGHCVSHPSTLWHDTALAQINIQAAVSIPKKILPNRHAILVWDNDDFAEEAEISTRITEGITIQKESTDHIISNIAVPRSRRKSFKAPDNEIPLYFIDKKKPPDLKSICGLLDINEVRQVSAQPVCQKMWSRVRYSWDVSRKLSTRLDRI